MGKKSNAKKAVRKLVKAKAEKEEKKGAFAKKKSKKEIKQEVLKSRKKKSKKSNTRNLIRLLNLKSLFFLKKLLKKITPNKSQKQKIFSMGLAAIMLALLIFIGFLIFKRAFKALPIAEFLPEESTVAILEINSNLQHNQVLKAREIIQEQSAFTPDQFLKSLKEKFGIDYQEKIQPWMGRQMGVALVEGESRLEEIYFAEIANRELAQAFNQQEKEAVLTAIVEDHLFMSSNEKVFSDFLNFQNSKEKRVADTDAYKRIINNTPLNKYAFVYLNFDKVNDKFFKKFSILSENGLSSSDVSAFIKLFESEGIAIVALDDKFAAQSFLSLNTEDLHSNKYITFDTKYSAELMQYVPEEALLFWGGSDLDMQIKRMVEVFAGGDHASMMMIENLLNNYSKKYFGNEINFQEDILPLFQNEYAFVIEKEEEQFAYKVLLELERPEADAFKVKKIAEEFLSVADFFETKTIEHTLSDGTVSKEIIAVPEEMQRSEEDFGELKIYSIEIANSDFGMHYAINHDYAIFANSKESIKRSLVTENSLHKSENFQENIAPILKNSDEITHINLQEVLPIFFQEGEVPIFLKMISTLSSGKNYFNDGISTITYLNVK